MLGVLAPLMAAGAAWLLKWSAENSAVPVRRAISVNLYATVATMPVVAVLYLLDPGFGSLSWTLGLNMRVMMGGAAALGGLTQVRSLGKGGCGEEEQGRGDSGCERVSPEDIYADDD